MNRPIRMLVGRAVVDAEAGVWGKSSDDGLGFVGQAESVVQLGDKRPGMIADLIVIDGNPLKKLDVLQGQGKHLAAIMKGGRFHKNTLH